MTKDNNTLKVKRLGINTRQEHIVYMREDCGVCKSEGFEALSRVLVQNGKKSIVATINSVRDSLLQNGEASLSESAWLELNVKEGDRITLSHFSPLESLRMVRAKLFGHSLSKSDFKEIIRDIYKGRFSNVHLAAFVSACVGERLSVEEITFLTEAMVEAGERIDWQQEIVVDKHCVGGLPGNRVTPIVVSIIAAAGLTIPKTSSRAITSPSGTADTMEVMTPVNLSLQKLKEVVTKTNGCIIWGGSVNLSPADDLIIRIERALDIDSEGQMIASVLSKKIAAGSTHVVLDIPVGPTAKVRTQDAAIELKRKLMAVSEAIGLNVKILITDGTQLIGRGIGPALEAKDVLSVLTSPDDAISDLLEKSLLISAAILELTQHCNPGEGIEEARKILYNGKAKDKFFSICDAQGGFREPPTAKHTHEIYSDGTGVIKSIDNRKLSRIAKLAGAPQDPAAGIEIFAKIGSSIAKGDPLYRIHAESKGELEYALSYVESQKDIFELGGSE